MFFVFRRSIMAKYFHHWLLFLVVIISGQYFINATTFSIIEFGAKLFREYRVNPLIPESIVLGRKAFALFEITIQVTGLAMFILTISVFTDWALIWVANKKCQINFGHILLLVSFGCYAYSGLGMTNFISELNSRNYSSDLMWSLDFINYFGN